MVYTFDDPKAGETHTTQYFEMFGNRGIYHDGWVAAARHSIPWLMVPLPPLTGDIWELYHVAEDFSQAHDLAARESGEAQGDAGPLHEGGGRQPRAADRRPPFGALRSRRSPGRPDLMGGRTSLTVYPGMLGMTENAFINVKNVAFTITAPVELRDAKTNGVIIAQAGAFGGWTLYMKDGKPVSSTTTSASNAPTSPGPPRSPPASTRLRTSSCPTARSRAPAATEPSTWTGRRWRRATSRRRSPTCSPPTRAWTSAWTTRPRCPSDYRQGDNKFTGRIVKVTIDVKPSTMSAEDKKAVEDAQDAAAIVQD